MGHGRNSAAFAALVFALAACATISPRSRIESSLVGLGLSRDHADCVGEALADNLSRRDLGAVANFLEDINRTGRSGGAIDALLRIDNPRAAAAAAAAGVTCALSE